MRRRIAETEAALSRALELAEGFAARKDGRSEMQPLTA
jgi:hypothetical protein